jgi:UDP-N-acetylmuramyl pentapeptide phosphotransferase/UDP-N-acetylglucosamine-1-phosphate transferase
VTLVEAYLPLYAICLDATTTLVRRLRRGERLTEAHRSHLYQRLANGGWGHARVTLLYAGVALAALPIASLPGSSKDLGIAAYFVGVLGLGVALDRRSARRRA